MTRAAVQSFLDLARARRSVRAFTDAAVPDKDVQTLIAAAIAAPSAGNRQAWHLYVVRNREILQQLAHEAAGQPFIADVPVAFVFCLQPDLNKDRYAERGRDLYCIQDSAAAIQNVLLAATDLGLGTCWCGGFNEAKAAEILGLPANRRPVAIVPIGHPAAEQDPQPGRRDVADVVDFLD